MLKSIRFSCANSICDIWVLHIIENYWKVLNLFLDMFFKDCFFLFFNITWCRINDDAIITYLTGVIKNIIN